MKARIAAVSLVSAALVVGGAAAAGAAPAVHAKPSLTLSASGTHVKKGGTVTFSGRASGLREGSTVTLQVKEGTHWKSLPVTTAVRHDRYRLTDRFRRAGVEVVRVVDGRTASKPLSVRVR
ncbi:hypothetical protein [Streptomyces sp. NPDC020362]|uniref:hypothetical protein n=1 Tax=unclassified Streptomyces TaxID=2593676 RepID=UPI000A59699B